MSRFAVYLETTVYPEMVAHRGPHMGNFDDLESAVRTAKAWLKEIKTATKDPHARAFVRKADPSNELVTEVTIDEP